MTRLTLVFLLGLSMLVSFSAQAGGRDGHHGNNHKHWNKHQRQFAHQNRHHYAQGHRCHKCRGEYRYRHGAYVQPYNQPYVQPLLAPGFEFGAAYGPSGVETVIVYRSR